MAKVAIVVESPLDGAANELEMNREDDGYFTLRPPVRRDCCIAIASMGTASCMPIPRRARSRAAPAVLLR